jgi:DNA modification methylase
MEGNLLSKELLGSLELNRIYQMDCVEGLKLLPNDCIDLTVTSPPYDNLRTYKNGREFDFGELSEQLYRVTKYGGIVVWVVGDATINGSETGTSFRQALHFKEIGFNLHDTMIYAKSFVPIHDYRNKRYKQAFEYMFVLSKGKPKTYNEIKDKPNKNAGKKAGGTAGRNYNDTKRKIKPFFINDFQARFNIWEYSTGNHTTKDKIAYEHPAIFPEDLAKDHILSWSNEGDIVLDPFMGSGTTAKMAQKFNRKFLGFEISPEYIQIANLRLESINEEFR